MISCRALTTDESQHLGAARADLLRAMPYFATALLAMRPIAAVGLGTFAVDDRWNLYIDPERLCEWTVPVIGAVLEHELGHLLRRHAERAKQLAVLGENRPLWNVACDAAINDDLLAAGRPLPSWVVTPDSLGLPAGLLEEEYFARLLCRSRTLTGSTSVCSSGVDGHRRDWELADSSDDVSRPRSETIRKMTAESMRRYRGSAPGSWQRWAATESRSAVEPRWLTELTNELRLTASRAGRGESRSFRVPRRRPAQTGIICPGRTRERLTAAVVVDTSGSMSPIDLAVALRTVEEIVVSASFRDVRAITCDARVQLVSDAAALHAQDLTGGGGTDMRIGIERAEQLGVEVIVVITDGDTPWPPRPPTVPVLVLLTRRSTTTLPQWLRTFELKG